MHGDRRCVSSGLAATLSWPCTGFLISEPMKPPAAAPTGPPTIAPAAVPSITVLSCVSAGRHVSGTPVHDEARAREQRQST